MTPVFKKKGGFNTFTTPVVTFQYPYLVTPDTKFNAEGDLKVAFTVPTDNYWLAVIEQMKEDIKAYSNEYTEKTKKKLKLSPDLPWTVNEEEDTITFKAKIRARYMKRDKSGYFEVKINQFDAKGKPITPMVEIRGGSTGRLSLELKPWDSSGKVGISLRPQAVQIITLSEGYSSDADSYGFGEEEGFSADDAEAFRANNEFADSGLNGADEDEELDF